MKKGFPIALLVVGIILIIWGISAADSFSSDISRAFTGSPTNKSVWLMLGGIVCAVVGFFGVTRSARGD
ncbi:MAG TPA: DUF3185 family protein [Candidatus Limnocylindria bacterium]|jgi:hypothetical protein|nr:DUF3185 family protein [Candidatus Limnocylindria bacterium]